VVVAAEPLRSKVNSQLSAIMDVDKLIEQLNAEIERIRATIACLEQYRGSSGTPATPSRRGRKSMGPEERLQVAERMKEYWAGRRRKQR
jgi:hypothetical protein